MTYSDNFLNLLEDVSATALRVHGEVLIKHAKANLADTKRSIKQLPPLSFKKQKSAVIISSGPSVHRKNIVPRLKESGFEGTLIVADGAYLPCLKAGIFPDHVMTLDPHPKRMVRFYGDPNLEKNFEGDDYIKRQDLDVSFRKINSEHNKHHIDLVNKYAHLTKAVMCTSTPPNVIERLKEAKFDIYWWNPLVDDPGQPDSLTRQLYELNKMPCLNTGGTVGTAAWVFASSFLKIPLIGLTGMDLGYYSDTSKEDTQCYYELIEHLKGEEKIDECFVEFEFPLTKDKFYTDPTYFWYRKNFLELARKSAGRTYNCTEGGTLFADNIPCIYLDDFFKLAAKPASPAGREK